ncbi:1-aminocyclopropane-1-carboxylate deaminase/D-cysteine desulfhydrase [Lacibacter sp.]|uniref:1-aminocyclopropane-1-carboxylate deaminase/D-cysteine desulfhydrase n=1 Tax=Lacibacter sp. TaxID=1915409 RepID=UPI002B4B6747|nr:pyridoxal-phosphate dependent enzyme [Lacibacter sp.]
MQTIPRIISHNTVEWPLTKGKSFGFTVARLDLLHPFISGNKYFKLKYNLAEANEHNKQGIITMGGAYSNHLAATAFACDEQGMSSVGIVRGEVIEPLNPTLSFCRKHNMKLISVRREDYASNSEAVQKIIQQHSNLFFVPEGGNNEPGMKGCQEILQRIPGADEFTHIICSIGTGTTFKGIASAANASQTVIGVPALKIKTDEQEQFILQHTAVPSAAKQIVLFEFAGKGYARTDEELINFMNSFYTKTSIPTDIVYTGKLMQAVIALAEQSYFPDNSKLLVIHSGGLQGNNSLPSGTLLF